MLVGKRVMFVLLVNRRIGKGCYCGSEQCFNFSIFLYYFVEVFRLVIWSVIWLRKLILKLGMFLVMVGLVVCKCCVILVISIGSFGFISIICVISVMLYIGSILWWFGSCRCSRCSICGLVLEYWWLSLWCSSVGIVVISLVVYQCSVIL